MPLPTLDLLRDVDGSTDPNKVGKWQSLLGYHPFSLTVEGQFSGAVKVLVSNAGDKPAALALNYPHLGDPGGFTQAGSLYVLQPYRWIIAFCELTSGLVTGVHVLAIGSERGVEER